MAGWDKTIQAAGDAISQVTDSATALVEGVQKGRNDRLKLQLSGSETLRKQLGLGKRQITYYNDKKGVSPILIIVAILGVVLIFRS